MKINTAIKLIRNNLTDDLLKPKYRKVSNRKLSTGHCYVATEALYHIMNPKQRKQYKPHYLKINNDTHWFLKGKKIIDVTYDQFDILPDYDNGKSAAFLTKFPSKRTNTLLMRIKNGSNVHTKNN